MTQHRGSSRLVKLAHGVIALTTFALVTSGCSPAPTAAAPPTKLGNAGASSSSATSQPPTSSTSSTPVPTVAAPAPTQRAVKKQKVAPKRPPAAPKTTTTTTTTKAVTAVEPPAPKPVKPVTPATPVAAPVKAVVVVMRPGNTGSTVRSLQARLRQISWFDGDVSDVYGPKTTASVRGFQVKRGFEATGVLDQTTWDQLLSMTRRPSADELNNVKPKPPEVATPAKPNEPTTPNEPAGLVWDEDVRCLTGRVMCVSKSARTLTWVVDGKAQYQFQVRFGSADLPTREGVFPVYRKARTLISNIDQSEMPFSMFFSGGEAVHYSPNFARVGYNGNSHGCVNVRDWNGIARLYSEVNLGDKVVVHW